jgi:hypothetical protein
MAFPGRPEMRGPKRAGRGQRPKGEVPSFPSLKVAEIAADKGVPWPEAATAPGPSIARDKGLRVVESRDGQPGKEVWPRVKEMEDKRIIR